MNCKVYKICRWTRGIAALLLAVLLCSLPVCANNPHDADDPAGAAKIADSILAAEIAMDSAPDIQTWINGTLTDGAGTMSEWWIMALSRFRPVYDFSTYATGLSSYVASGNASGSVTGQRYALALLFTGCREDPFIASVLQNSVGKQGIMSLIFGLHLQRLGNLSDTPDEASDTLAALLDREQAGGGWALNGDTADVDVTAMAVQALAPYASDETVARAIDRAVQLLSDRRLPDGTYVSYGKANAESTAQVIVALSALGIDCTSDVRFTQNGVDPWIGLLSFRREDGTFSHTADGVYDRTATVQALMAAVALWRMQQGISPFYPNSASELSVQTAPEAVTDTAVPESMELPAVVSPVSLKVELYLVCLAAGGIVCLIFLLQKKRNIRSYLAVAALTGAVCLLISLTDIRRPSEYYGMTDGDGYPAYVTLTIRCDTAVSALPDILPADGIFLPDCTVGAAVGDSVSDVTIRAAQQYGLLLDFSGSGELAYIRGINGLYEFACGDLSGWIYRVNGEIPPVGCGAYILQDGDRVEWLYSCDYGNDLG